MIFQGLFEFARDAGRVRVPARFRPAFANGGVLIPSLDSPGLRLYPLHTWQRMVRGPNPGVGDRDEYAALQRHFAKGVDNVMLDARGRIVVPRALRNHIDARETVLVYGLGLFVEIKPATYEEPSPEAARERAAERERIRACLRELGL